MSLQVVLLRRVRFLRTALLSILILFFLLSRITPAEATDFNPGCTAGVGDAAALQNAILISEHNLQPDMITLSTGCIYTITDTLTVLNDGGTLLTINGNGATISGSDLVQILLIRAGSHVNLNNVTIAHGTIGILNLDAYLTINDSTFSSNFGGIRNIQGTVTVNHCTFTGNSADQGGAIYNNAGTLMVDQSIFTGNSATDLGGAMLNTGFDGNISVQRSLFSSNSATNNGGAFYNSVAPASFVNSTFTDNHATYGGGIYLFGGGNVSLLNDTVSANTATTSGGGIYNFGSLTFFLSNVLIAGNSAPASPDMNGPMVSYGYNLIGSSSGVIGTNADDLVDAATTPLNLGPLASNGGPTQTLALLAGSVAIDHGSPSYMPPPDYDQRGVGFPRVRGGRIDIGAYEAPGPSTLTLQLTLQGRVPAPPNSVYVTTTHVQVRPTGGGAPVFTGDFDSNTSGQAVIPDLPLGSYTIWVKGMHTLAIAQSVLLVSGVNNVTTPTLKEGDANDSNTVTITDFAILAAAFGKSTGQVGYDAQADFNQDGAITITDFSLLALNFGQAGAS